MVMDLRRAVAHRCHVNPASPLVAPVNFMFGDLFFLIKMNFAT
jgi:hypothetical protein